jgi:small subunit ribosomal protein S4
MTKRKARFYRTLRFYNQDLFGRLVIKDPKRYKPWIGFKNAKINNFLYEKKEEVVERLRRKYSGMGPEKFAYRIDIFKTRRRFRRVTRFGHRLKTRFILRRFASEMTVRQFRSYVKKSAGGSFIFLKFLSKLERRLDFIVFRLNFFQTSGHARQAINHGAVLLNGVPCFFPSTEVNFNDIISVANKPLFYKQLLKNFRAKLVFRGLPAYIEANYRIMSAIFLFNPKKSKISYPVKIKSNLLASIGKRFN